MVSIVVVSHSEKLATGVVDLVRMMAKEVKIATAGGLEDGSHGTSFDKINKAIDEVYSDDGVILINDMGSAIMTSEMVIESSEKEKLFIADCPIVEGTLEAAVLAENGNSIEEIINELKNVGSMSKTGL